MTDIVQISMHIYIIKKTHTHHKTCRILFFIFRYPLKSHGPKLVSKVYLLNELIIQAAFICMSTLIKQKAYFLFRIFITEPRPLIGIKGLSSE